MSEKEKDQLADVEDLDVEPLTDDDLDSVAGGLQDCSCTYTTGSCTASASEEIAE